MSYKALYDIWCFVKRHINTRVIFSWWSDTTYCAFVILILFEMTGQSTRSGGVGASCVRPWLTRFVLVGVSQVSKQSEVRNHKQRTLNTGLSSGASVGTFAVSAGTYMNYRSRYKKRTWLGFCVRVKVGLDISRTNADSQWNPAYNAFHRIFCCGNETIRR